MHSARYVQRSSFQMRAYKRAAIAGACYGLALGLVVGAFALAPYLDYLDRIDQRAMQVQR
jgi:hypothetical protein